MVQSSQRLHVGIVMDGNGRWAERRGLPRPVGHRAGVATVRRIVEAAPGLSIGTLTLYAFSSDNWRRPLPEVHALMGLFRRYLEGETSRCVAQGVRLNVIGRRDRLPGPLCRAIEEAESATAMGSTLVLRIAVDYSSRDAIRRAAGEWARHGVEPPSLEEMAEWIARVDHAREAPPPLDLLIRSGGEQRLSDFLLWEAAYAELFFRPELWPDFSPHDLAQVIGVFRTRDRRFGGISTAKASGPARSDRVATPEERSGT